ncbi:MAG: hypothetical protein R2742_15065 [Micropruina glycogenica]
MIVLDDEIATWRLLVELFDKLREVGVNSISAACAGSPRAGGRAVERPA